MPNLAKIYSGATTVNQSVKEQTEEDKAHEAQLKADKFNWLNNPVTQEMIKSMVEDENKLVTQAVNLACEAEPRYNLITQILVRVHTSRILRETYGKVN